MNTKLLIYKCLDCICDPVTKLQKILTELYQTLRKEKHK